jgi:hypothetical protein
MPSATPRSGHAFGSSAGGARLGTARDRRAGLGGEAGRRKINALLGKRMSLEEIAEKLNLENVPTIHSTNRWTAASVRKAFVS